jgi:hypothetical protein
MATRSPDWSQCDVLLKEVGALRAATNRRTDLDDAGEADINLKIVAAAQAIDDLISCPDSDEKAVLAWEAIILAKDLVEGLRQTTAHSGELVSRAVQLRRRALDAMAEAERLSKNQG